MTDMAYKVPSNFYEMVELFAQGVNAKKITKLRSTIK